MPLKCKSESTKTTVYCRFSWKCKTDTFRMRCYLFWIGDGVWSQVSTQNAIAWLYVAVWIAVDSTLCIAPRTIAHHFSSQAMLCTCIQYTYRDRWRAAVAFFFLTYTRFVCVINKQLKDYKFFFSFLLFCFSFLSLYFYSFTSLLSLLSSIIILD